MSTLTYNDRVKDFPKEVDEGSLPEIFRIWAQEDYKRELTDSELVYLQEKSWELLKKHFKCMIDDCSKVFEDAPSDEDEDEAHTPNTHWLKSSEYRKILDRSYSNIFSGIHSAPTFTGSIKCMLSGHEITNDDKNDALSSNSSKTLTACARCKSGLRVRFIKRNSGKFNYIITEL